MQIVAITGGIASGKSTVTEMFRALGATVYSADTDARAVLAPDSPILSDVFTLFPEVRLTDGSLDRAALAARIFGAPEARKRLEAITHPEIIARMQATIDAARKAGSPGVLVYEVPLLYERDLAPLFDAVIAVLASPAQQAERLQAREARGGRPLLSVQAIQDRLAAQIAPEEKARRADYVVHTGGSLSTTEAEVTSVWRSLTGSAV